MTPFETQLLAILGPLIAAMTTLLGLYIKDRVDQSRLGTLEDARKARATALDELSKSRAETLAAQAELNASKLNTTMAENTRLTQRAGDQAEAAFQEANTVNNKIAKLTALGNDQVAAMERANAVPATPAEVVITNPEPVPVTVTVAQPAPTAAAAADATMNDNRRKAAQADAAKMED